MPVLVGGVGQLYQGDLDLGRRAVELLAEDELGDGVLVEELHYGAVAVAQRLEELRPTALLLIGAEERGRPAGTVERRETGDLDLSTAEVQAAVADAGTGYVTIGLVLEVAWGLGVLPERTVTFEVEPASTTPAENLSPSGRDGLETALALLRQELAHLRRAEARSSSVR